ncbi:D-2-hydroxyacid dehydrogenase [Arthrobacter sp. I2-34]|uniref:D-2-hydroxyacid dehydrogenase n=1 Tax=Arthrobacter hankyongi TaxID=2904801 RepID=A0ABS9L3X7_9MICC|nr:D-2-hydroxyacid dehydrogenase [Arthrobacter hankyongi]MCG2621370.1 D-2-hydroxyacid dehydrogenase [Arthrobacter hankyongi]
MRAAAPPRRPRVVILAAGGQEPPRNLAELRARADVVLADAAGLPAVLPGADVLFLWDFFSPALRAAWPQAGALRWVHVAAAGVDAVLFEELRGSPVVLTNAHGVFDAPIAEFVLASILAHDKQLHLSKSLQRQGQWRHREPTRTAGSRALVVGTGGIGRATARLLRAVGLQVRGAGRTARGQDQDFGTVVPSAELAAHAGWADHLVLAAPLTAQTHHLVDARVLAAMQPAAHLVNVGRGALLDEAALLEALRSGRIAAASLDVFEQEPLPAGHPFWQLENVHVSAHLSGDVAGWRDALADQFRANLDRYVAGAPLANVVDKALGYLPSS